MPESLLFVLADPVREPEKAQEERHDQGERREEAEHANRQGVSGGSLLQEEQHEVDHSEALSPRGLVGQLSGVISWLSVTQSLMRQAGLLSPRRGAPPAA